MDWNGKFHPLHAIDGSPEKTTNKGNVMNNKLNNEQFTSNEQTSDAKVPYAPPALTVIGKVEHLTALLDHGVPDLVSHGNII
jgi:hypothetical protein